MGGASGRVGGLGVAVFGGGGREVVSRRDE